jgi:branched-chain amino acid transport system substrate-binding protein
MQFLQNYILLLSALIFGALSAHADTPGVSKSEILLGQSAAFTGTSAGLGSALWRGAQAYFDKVNSQGGVHGRQIHVLSLDDKYDGDLTLPNTINLITEKKVFALFGYVGTPTLTKALPAIQRYSDEGIFLFSNFTGAQPQREPPHDKYVFNVRASYRQETKAIVDHLTKLGFTRIGVFIQDDAYGRSGADGVQRALKEKSLSTAQEVTYVRGAPISASMAEQAGLLLKAKVQAVVSIGSYAACGAFIRDARSAGFEGPIANVSFVGADSLLELLISAGEKQKSDLTRKLINSQVVPLPTDLSIPLVKEYREAMKRFNPQVPEALRDPTYRPREYGFGSLEGFLNAKLFVEVLKHATEPLTRQSFVKSLESIGTQNTGLREKISFSHTDHQALDSVFFTTIKKNKYIELTSWEDFK